MSRKTIFYIVFFILLFGGFMYGLGRAIPGFGDVKLPVLSYVQPFSFQDQDGKTITKNDVLGKVYVAEYFFTTCKGFCPKMNANMKQVYTLFKDKKDFAILSHTVDPETDSVSRLKRYSDSLHVGGGSWRFLTGSKDSLYKTARQSYLLDDPKNNSEDIANQFIHTQFFALVDKNGRVRKIYDGLKKEELLEMEKDIRDLLKEKATGPFANSLFNNNPE
jgi:protein SCO1